MNNKEVHTMLSRNKRTKSRVIGVFSANTLHKPKILGKKHFHVANLEPSDKSGSHWMAIMLSPKGKKYLFWQLQIYSSIYEILKIHKKKKQLYAL